MRNERIVLWLIPEVLYIFLRIFLFEVFDSYNDRKSTERVVRTFFIRFDFGASTVKCIFIMSVLVFASVFATERIAQAQKGSSPQQDERRENERVAKAERALTEIKKELSAIQKELRSEMGNLEKAKSALPLLKKKSRDAREEAEDRLGVKLGIPEALAKVRQAGTALEEIAVVIRERLHKSPTWIHAKDAADQAKKARELLLDDIENVGNNIDDKLKDLAVVMHKPLELENEAIAKDSIAIEATKQLSVVQLELEKKRKLLPSGEVEKDRKVLQSVVEIEKKEKEIDSIETKLRKVGNEANKIQRRFVDAQVSLQKAKAADAADSNRPKKKNKK